MESAKSEGVPKAGIEENRSSWYREMMVSAKTEISQILGILRHAVLYDADDES